MKVLRLFCLVLTLEIGLSLPQASGERMTAGFSAAAPVEEALAAACVDRCADCADFVATDVCPIYCGAVAALTVEAPGTRAARLRIPVKAGVDGGPGLANPPDPAPPRYASPI